MRAEEGARRPSSVPEGAAVAACAAMAVSYVGFLYLPTLVFRLPPPVSLNAFMIRRFVCAFLSSLASVFATSVLLLGVGSIGKALSFFQVFGIRGDHMWRAASIPVILTSTLYSGSLLPRFLTFACLWRDDPLISSHDGLNKMNKFKNIQERVLRLAGNVLAWRNYLVAPITEELVFRACMIPLLLCGGFRKYSVIFFSPVFFSLAHLNHLLELYYQQGHSFKRASMVMGWTFSWTLGLSRDFIVQGILSIQLGYTVIFGWYAAFLFVRTGNFISPVVAHIFCNIMGLPTWSRSRSQVIVGASFAFGILCFLYLLFPMTDPVLYNDHTDDCRCWQGYCTWG